MRLADEAYALGGQTAAESYLNTEAILKAIDDSGADGVHPGLRLLQRERRLRPGHHRQGRDLHRPAAGSHRRDGRQGQLAPKAALRGGAPIVPGTTEFVTSVDEILAFGAEFGYPLAIKAAFGGGGRGMKVVLSADEVQEAMDSAKRESKAFFGRDEIYIERYLTWPRHVEVQIVGDQHGNVVWVSTRDCSAQRRHQKLIEEAPGVRPGSRRRRGDGRGGHQGGQGGRLLQRRHGRVHLPGRRVLLPGDEHPPAGRAPGHRGDHRHRPRRVADPRRQRRAAADDARGGAGSPARPRHRGAHQRREPRGRKVPAVPRHDHQAGHPRRLRHPLRRRLREPATRSASTTTT